MGMIKSPSRSPARGGGGVCFCLVKKRRLYDEEADDELRNDF